MECKEKKCIHQKNGKCFIKCGEGSDAAECAKCKCLICDNLPKEQSTQKTKPVEKVDKPYVSKARVTVIEYEAGVTVEYKGKWYKETYRERREFDGNVEVDIEAEKQLLIDAVHDVVDKAILEAAEASK